MPNDVRTRFLRYLDELAEIARARDDVLGLVAFGSTADRSRVDEWSDHDFAWITEPDAAGRYRHDLSWLPDHDRIALSVVEHHGGVKVVYDDVRRLEFGIADVDAARELRLMLTQIHSGVGRHRRGETLSASGLVRFEAVLAEEELATAWDDFPHTGVAAVRARMGWE